MQVDWTGFRGKVWSGCFALTAMLCLATPKVCAEDGDGGALRWTAQGDQIYRCSQDSGSPHWVLEGPQAVLKDKSGLVRAEHEAGPVWRAGDGSEVQGVVVATIPAPKLDAISWLVLRVSRHAGRGLLDSVAYILRTDTDGGIAPETGCDAARSGRLVTVPYRATYTFIAAAHSPSVK